MQRPVDADISTVKDGQLLPLELFRRFEEATASQSSKAMA